MINVTPRRIALTALGTLLIAGGAGATTAFATSAGASTPSHISTSTVDRPEAGDTPDASTVSIKTAGATDVPTPGDKADAADVAGTGDKADAADKNDKAEPGDKADASEKAETGEKADGANEAKSGTDTDNVQQGDQGGQNTSTTGK